MTLDSLNQTPYQCKKHEDSFVFTTQHNVTYEIYYLDGQSYLPDTSFGIHTKILGFKPFESEIKYIPFDPRIAATILHNIEQQFTNKNTVIIYSCDQSDSREKARRRLFNGWFKLYNIELQKVDLDFDDTLFVSILYHPDNIYKLEILQTIPELKNKLD